MAQHPSFDPDVKVSLHPALGLKPNYGKQVIKSMDLINFWTQNFQIDSFGHDNAYEELVN